MTIDDAEDIKMPYGKYKGLPVTYVAKKDPEYIIWVNTKATGDFKKNIQDFVNSHLFRSYLTDYKTRIGGEELYLRNHKLYLETMEEVVQKTRSITMAELAETQECLKTLLPMIDRVPEDGTEYQAYEKVLNKVMQLEKNNIRQKEVIEDLCKKLRITEFKNRTKIKEKNPLGIYDSED